MSSYPIRLLRYTNEIINTRNEENDVSQPSSKKRIQIAVVTERLTNFQKNHIQKTDSYRNTELNTNSLKKPIHLIEKLAQFDH